MSRSMNSNHWDRRSRMMALEQVKNAGRFGGGGTRVDASRKTVNQAMIVRTVDLSLFTRTSCTLSLSLHSHTTFTHAHFYIADKGNHYKIEKELTAYDEDATVVIDHLMSRPDCTGKIGATGMCLGGHLAFRVRMSGVVSSSPVERESVCAHILPSICSTVFLSLSSFFPLRLRSIHVCWQQCATLQLTFIQKHWARERDPTR